MLGDRGPFIPQLTNPMISQGQMIYGDTDGSPLALPIGNNGEVLTLVSGLPNWEPGGSGGSASAYGPSMKPGIFYHDNGALGQNTTAILNFMTWTPIVFGRSCTLDTIGIAISTGVASAIARVGLYEDTEGYPGALLLTVSNNIDCSTSGPKTVTVNQAVLVGIRYWAGVVFQGATPDYQGWTADTSGAASITNSTPNVSVSGVPRRAGVSGALPNPASPDGGNFPLSPWPAILLKASS